MLPKQIRTIKDFHQVSYKEKGSEFLAIVYPVDYEETALNHLAEIRKKYFDATHHCYSYKIKSGEFKYSDDGEPNGTAGIRIQNAIDHFGLTDLIVIVVRYFGGTKLGVGPLGKAYYTAAMEVLQQSVIVTKTLYQNIEVEVDFDFISQVHRIMNQFSAVIINSQFTSNVHFNCLIIPDSFDLISIELTNLTNGKVLIEQKPEFEYLSQKK